MVLYCPFCGASLNCPEPPPERAMCYRCRAEFSPALLIRTSKRPVPVAQPVTAAAPASTVAVEIGQPLPEREELAATGRRRAGLTLIIVGVLVTLTSPLNASMAAFALAGAQVAVEWSLQNLPVRSNDEALQREVRERVGPGTMLALGIAYAVAGMFIITAGVSAITNFSRSLTYLGIALCFLPSCSCCVIGLPAGIYAARELARG